MNITHLLMKVALLGGEWVLWLLLVLSAISLTVIIEKSLYFFRSRVSLSLMGRELEKLLNDGGTESAKQYLRMHDRSPQARIVLAGLEVNPGGRSAVENAMTARQAMERNMMERHLGFLATLGNNAPFIGLFGTVLGIMGAFYKLHVNVSGGTSVVMKDISEALVATAAGLFVAIPAVIFNNLFRQRIRKAISEATVLGSILIGHVESRQK